MADTSVPPESATRIVLSYDGDDDTERSLTHRSYRRYLQRSKAGPVTVGDQWEEFVNCGCGTTADVTLVVETVDGGSVIDEETTIEYQRRET